MFIVNKETDICWRLAARYGFDFYIVQSNYAWITTKESGHQHPSENREATYQELNMWVRLVPKEERDIISKAGMYQKIQVPTATPEEVFCAIMYRSEYVYMARQDFVIVQKLEGFEPSIDREELKRGLMGRFSIPNQLIYVYVSRDIPHGYFLPADKEIKGLNWSNWTSGARVVWTSGERKIPDLEDRVDMRLLSRIKPLMIDRYILSQFGDQIKLRNSK
jgi:hypothetical protein